MFSSITQLFSSPRERPKPADISTLGDLAKLPPIHTSYDPTREERHITLSNGRIITYGEYGSPTGVHTVFMLHGTPGCRYNGAFLHDEALKHNIRLIAPDRPGFGLSTDYSSKTLLAYADDVLELADVLDINRFYVMGASGGGPHALACAYKIPSSRLIKTGVIAGMGVHGSITPPFEMRLISGLLTYAPWLTGMMLFSIPVQKLVDEVYIMSLKPKIKKQLMRGDGKDLTENERDEMVDMYVTDLRQTYRQGNGGMLSELKLFFGDWGFRIEDVKGNVEMWHGSKDGMVKVEYARWLKDRLPDVKYHEWEGLNHLTIWRRKEDILSMLIAG